MKEILIIGSNVAGVSAATALRSEGFAGIVRLIDADPQLPYERPPLSKGALSGAALSPTLLREEAFYREMSLDLVLGRRIVSLRADLVARLDDGRSLRADAIVLATGARAKRLTVPGSDDPRVTTMRTWADAVRIAEHLRPNAPIVILGGGLIGAEVAAAARVRGCDVTWIQRGPTCLRGPLGITMATACVASHRARGVRVIPSGEVVAVAPGAVLRVHLRGGEQLEAALLVLGIGVEPEVGLALNAGAEVDDGVVVNTAGRTTHPRVFAAGDVARVRGSTRREHWQRAIEQGTNVARALLDREIAPPEVAWFWSDQYDRHLEVAGDLHDADQEIVRGQPEAGDGSVFALRDGRVVGVATCNRPRETRAAMRLIRAGKRVSARDLAIDGTDLRQVALGDAA